MQPLTAKQHEALVVLEQNGGSVSKAAKCIGISEYSLSGRIERIKNAIPIDPLNPHERRRYLQESEDQKEDRQKPKKRKPFKRCARKCRYRAPVDAPWGCEYALLTGGSRGCQPGKNCEKFEPSTRKCEEKKL